MSDAGAAAPVGAGHSDVWALLPAAGRALRLAGIARGPGAEAAGVSKEVLPVRFPSSEADDRLGDRRPAAAWLLESLGLAGVVRCTVVLREGKDDVRRVLGRGDDWGVRIDYRTTPGTPSVAHTLALALADPPTAAARVALGFPDILFTPRDAFVRLLDRQRVVRADLALGLFPTRQPGKTDMVELDAAGRVRALRIKQPDAGLRYTWSIAAWSPSFSSFLLQQVALYDRTTGEAGPAAAAASPRRELQVGDVINAWLAAGGAVEAVCFPGGSYHDIGTPEDLARAGWSAD